MLIERYWKDLCLLAGMGVMAGTAIVYGQVGGGGVSETATFPTKYVRLNTGVAFASLPTCSAALVGSLATITDSTAVTWGGTITGTSSNTVLGFCDGTNWTVAGK